jgi:hypothetical protein
MCFNRQTLDFVVADFDLVAGVGGVPAEFVRGSTKFVRSVTSNQGLLRETKLDVSSADLSAIGSRYCNDSILTSLPRPFALIGGCDESCQHAYLGNHFRSAVWR